MFQFEIGDHEELSSSNESLNKAATVTVPADVEFHVGDRIKCDSHSGVVRYIGEVSPHTGIWLGIEWDNPARGKHDGSVQGVEYFKTMKPNAASFIRTHKAKRGRDIISALHERYGYDEAVMNRLKQIDNRMENIHVTYKELRILDLSSKEISELGRPGELAELCPQIEFLDLAENMITTWDPIAELCATLKTLKRLDVSANPFVEPAEQEVPQNSFDELEHLIIGRVKYGWANILTLSSMWPKISNLQVPFNLISRLYSPINTLLNLTSLDLEGNQITSWEDIVKLNACQKLEYLNLCANSISTVRFPVDIHGEPNSQCTDIFPNLARLNLTENLIEDWVSITELNKLAGLRELRIDLNPFHEKDTRDNNRQMIIARMRKLLKLEGVGINRQERRDAELDYIKKFSTKWDAEGTELRFSVEHPRYLELVQKWGATEVGELSSGIKTMKTSLITVQVIPQDPGYKPCSKKVLPNMSVHKLKMLLQRALKVTTSIDVKVVSARNPNISFTLDNDFFELSQYSVEDGDKLLVTW